MMQIDITHARTLTDMSAFLQYLVSIYGAELYKDKQRLYNLIADLYTGEERQKKLFRRAIMEDNMAQRVYELKNKTIGERKALADAIAYRFAENNYFSNEIGQKVTLAFVKGLNLLLEITLKQREDGKWEDNQGCIYSKDKKTFEKGNRSLSAIVIRDGVTEIGNEAFSEFIWYFLLLAGKVPNLPSWSSITIPDSVTKIGRCAFYGCTFLNIEVSANNANFMTIDGVLYSKDRKELVKCPNAKVYLIIPDGVTEICNSAVLGCTSLASITIPNSVTKIESLAFYGCTSLTSITIPNSVTKIESLAFSGCTSLTSITIPNSVTRIGASAFRGCTSLSSITIPESVSEIGDSVFYGCTSLKNIRLSADNKSYAFENGALYDLAKKELLFCTNRKNFVIPNSVIEIGKYAFNACTSLSSITIPESVTEIGDSAFSGCTSLSSIVFRLHLFVVHCDS